MRRRASLLCVLLVLLIEPGAEARGDDDAIRAYKDAVTRVRRQRRLYEHADMDRDLRRAYEVFIKPWLDRGKPDAPNEIEYDFDGYRKVYDTWARFADDEGAVTRALGGTPGRESVRLLFRALVESVDEILLQTREVKKSKPKSFVAHDQVAPIRRYGARRLLDAIVEAIGKTKDAEGLDYLIDVAWPEAEKSDKRRKSDATRIALLDAIARTGSLRVQPLLEAAADAGTRRLRIVGLEGLATLPLPPEALRTRLLASLDGEPCFAVRVAVLDTFATTARDPRVVPHLAKALDREIAGANGVLRAVFRRTLTAIVGKDLGPAPGSWLAWYAKNRKAIEDGSWVRGEDEKGEAGSERDSVAFYNVRTVSKRLLLLLDASDTLIMPVDVELAKKRNVFEWSAMGKKRRNYVTQWELLERETLGLIDSLDADARFNLAVMNGSSQLKPFSPRGMAPGDAKVKSRVKPFLDAVVVGGWAPQIQAVWWAYEQAGIDPWGGAIPDQPHADTFFLLSDGVPSGGQIISGPAIIDEVTRQHRFARIPIHTIRIADIKDTAEEVMKGIAEATGGTYVWRQKP